MLQIYKLITTNKIIFERIARIELAHVWVAIRYLTNLAIFALARREGLEPSLHGFGGQHLTIRTPKRIVVGLVGVEPTYSKETGVTIPHRYQFRHQTQKRKEV